MKTTLKKTIALLLCLAMALGYGPVEVHAAESFYWFEASKTAPIRTEPSKNGSVLSYVDTGTLLMAIGSTTNKHGNVWLKVQTPLLTGYIYSNNVHAHEHRYYASADDCWILYCTCGSLKSLPKDGMNSMGAGAAALPAITPGVLSELGKVAAGMATAAPGVLSAVFPYVAVTAVSGCLVYMALNVSQTQVQVKTVSRKWEAINGNHEVEDGLYYYGKLMGNLFMIAVNDSMDQEEACKAIKGALLGNTFYYASDNIWHKNFWFVYTSIKDDAEELAKIFTSRNPFYAYIPENAHSCSMRELEHYHIILKSEVNKLYKDHLGSHICYGLPSALKQTSNAIPVV